jgi:hypothetical protein
VKSEEPAHDRLKATRGVALVVTEQRTAALTPRCS